MILQEFRGLNLRLFLDLIDLFTLEVGVVITGGYLCERVVLALNTGSNIVVSDALTVCLLIVSDRGYLSLGVVGISIVASGV